METTILKQPRPTEIPNTQCCKATGIISVRTQRIIGLHGPGSTEISEVTLSPISTS